MVAIRPRRWGLRFLAVGLLLILLPGAVGLHSIGGWSPRFLGVIAAGLAVPFLVVSIVRKRRYHRQRHTVA